MTDVRPFRALRYDPHRVEVGRVLAPPYDVVTDAEREALWTRDPHNAARLELTRHSDQEADTSYADVAERLRAWQREGVLRRDPEPALYLLRQRYVDPEGAARARDGFFALLRLEDYERRVVRPHERTLSGPKADRLKLLRATGANLSPVFMLYEDRDDELGARLADALEAPPALEARDAAGVQNTLVPATDRRLVGAVQEFLAKRPVVIADGHHRYETALAYRDWRRAQEPGAGPDAPFEWVLAYFANAFAPGTRLLPIHRVVLRGPAPGPAAWREGLPGWEIREIPLPSVEALPEVLAEHLAPLVGRTAFVADDGSGVLRLVVRTAPAASGGEEQLPIRTIHREVLGGLFGLDDDAVREGAVAFPKSAPEAARVAREAPGRVALYLNPLRPDDVFRVTARGELMPQKSTFFAPKLATGLVFRTLDEEGGA